MPKESTLQLIAQVKNLPEIRRYIRDQATVLEIGPSSTYDVLLAVTEMVTNILVHGYKGKAGPLEIQVSLQGDELVVCLKDQAPPFDPTRLPVPDISVPLEDRPLGGMGIHLTREFMDRVTYRYSSQGQNQLTLVKRIHYPEIQKEHLDADDS